MEDELARATPGLDTYLSVGVFDGVHMGHRHLLDLLKAQAAQSGCLAGVVTFCNHPRAVLSPGASIPLLTSPEERVRLLHGLGIPVVAPVAFTREVSLLSAQEFLRLLQKHLHMRGLVVGPDFALGHDRQGTPEVLRALGKEMGFAVTVADFYLQGQERVSSTVVRSSLAQGDLPAVARYLGRRYALAGTVAHGLGRGGTELGYPTANLEVSPEIALPADGIYATWAYVGQRRYMAATSIGVRPTFGQGNLRTVEAYLLDFRGDLYGQSLRLEFAHRLRDEAAFPGVEALKAQIAADVEETRRVLQE
ncbi:MAG: bifunctional riboflavin kinase/FAD synthetase [Chloroflexi bacterium]|nr:bifunctional riboflavin kinase/FAD synthetase [Chloroflexota bacterium]